MPHEIFSSARNHFSNDALELMDSGVEGERDISTRAHMHCHTPLLFAWRKSCVGNITEIYFYHALTASHCRIHTHSRTLYLFILFWHSHITRDLFMPRNGNCRVSWPLFAFVRTSCANSFISIFQRNFCHLETCSSRNYVSRDFKLIGREIFKQENLIRTSWCADRKN